MMKRFVITFLVIAVLHNAAQFMAWSFHPGNAVPGALSETGSMVSRTAWATLSFPLVRILPDRWGMAAFLINSLLWGLIGAALFARLPSKRRS